MCEGSHTLVAKEMWAETERRRGKEGGKGAKKSAGPNQLNNLSFYTWLSFKLYL